MSLRWHPAGAQRRLKALVTARVRERLDAPALGEASPADRRLRVREETMAVLREHRVVLPARDLTRLINEVSDEVVGLGPIEFLLKDPEVSEVMVNGADDVYVERKGRILNQAVEHINHRQREVRQDQGRVPHPEQEL